MKEVNPKVQNLIDKLMLSEKIYRKAASRSHNRPMLDQLNTIADRKHEFLEEIATHSAINLGKHAMNMADRIKLEVEKAEIEINHLIIHRNEKDILNFCIAREEELIDAYENLIGKRQSDEFDDTLFQTQLKDTKKVLEELKETRKAYEYH